MDDVEERGVEVPVLRERRVDADLVHLRRHGRDGGLDDLAEVRIGVGRVVRRVLEHGVRHAGGEVLADVVGLGREVLVVQEGDERRGDQHVEHVDDRVAPGAEQPRHLLLLRALRGGGIARADPVGAVHHRRVDRHDHDREEVEVPQVVDVVGVDEALPRHAVGHHRHDFAAHRELPEEEHHEAGDGRVEDHALDRVRDHERERPAEADERDREREEEDHERHVGRELDPEDVVRLRQVEHLDEEARRDGGHDHVGEHLRERAEPRRDDAEAPAVAHLEELPEAHRARLAEAVGDVPREPQHDPQRREDGAPEADREARLVPHLDVADEPDDRERVGHVAHRDHVPPAQAPGGEEVGHAAHVAPGVEPHVHHEAHGEDQDQPVVPGHGRGLVSMVGRGWCLARILANAGPRRNYPKV